MFICACECYFKIIKDDIVLNPLILPSICHSESKSEEIQGSARPSS